MIEPTLATGAERDELDAAATEVQRNVGGAFFRRLASRLPPDSPWSYAADEDVPEPLARAAASYLHFNSPRALGTVIIILPWLARGRAEDFYFPAEVCKALHTPWDPSYTLEVLRVRRDYYGPPRPVVAESRPGRNDPCSCGSGKKYKRCCGQ